MELEKINNSSSISYMGYDPLKKEMEVMFHPRGNYLYKDISQLEYDTIRHSGSIGSQLKITVAGKVCVNLRLV